MDVNHYRIVTRMSSCIIGKPNERDFRDHGAVERQGNILVFRPKDIDDRMKTRPVVLHGEMVSSLETGKEGDGYEISHLRYKDGDKRPEVSREKSARVEVVAYEEAGEEGIKQV